MGNAHEPRQGLTRDGWKTRYFNPSMLSLIWADDHSLIWDNFPYAFYDAVPYSRDIGWFPMENQKKSNARG
jgi:hypothetical protein